jgi:hypothetical protein
MSYLSLVMWIKYIGLPAKDYKTDKVQHFYICISKLKGSLAEW